MYDEPPSTFAELVEPFPRSIGETRPVATRPDPRIGKHMRHIKSTAPPTGQRAELVALMRIPVGRRSRARA